MRQLQGHLAVEQAVSALGQPHAGHAALTDFAHEPVWAHQRLRRQFCNAGSNLGPREDGWQWHEVVSLADGMDLQQFFEQRRKPRLTGRQRREPSGLRAGVEIKRRVEQSEDVLPVAGRGLGCCRFGRDHGKFKVNRGLILN